MEQQRAAPTSLVRNYAMLFYGGLSVANDAVESLTVYGWRPYLFQDHLMSYTAIAFLKGGAQLDFGFCFVITV